MKRFHVHVQVDDLAASTRFYAAMFGAEPSVLKTDYAKWMLEDPRINFAISARGGKTGVNHLGFQLDSDDELRAMRQQVEAADAASLVEQSGTTCCYAKSDKYWVTDPTGIPWETYHTLDSVPVFGVNDVPGAEPVATSGSACCAPATAPVAASAREAPATSCCAPAVSAPSKGGCC
jgi:catechol 2,3-dioxygenase-like lactoylglutathione lyase family enzyme